MIFFWTTRILTRKTESKPLNTDTRQTKGTILSIVTLVEEVRPVVMEKNEFEQRDQSKKFAFWHSHTVSLPVQ